VRDAEKGWRCQALGKAGGEKQKVKPILCVQKHRIKCGSAREIPQMLDARKWRRSQSLGRTGRADANLEKKRVKPILLVKKHRNKC
jgi:hypothetical protein